MRGGALLFKIQNTFMYYYSLPNEGGGEPTPKILLQEKIIIVSKLLFSLTIGSSAAHFTFEKNGHKESEITTMTCTDE